MPIAIVAPPPFFAGQPDLHGWDAVLELPFGKMAVRCAQTEIQVLQYVPTHTPVQAPTNPLAHETCRQLLAYCRDPCYRFDLPLATAGTVFQQRVWSVLRGTIPGSTQTYGEVAKLLRSAARAVGQACAANPYPPVVPCHRVVSSTGLGGFAHSVDVHGELLHIKRWLLQHEGAALPSRVTSKLETFRDD